MITLRNSMFVLHVLGFFGMHYFEVMVNPLIELFGYYSDYIIITGTETRLWTAEKLKGHLKLGEP